MRRIWGQPLNSTEQTNFRFAALNRLSLVLSSAAKLVESHLILGGGGFIGRHVTLLLARAGNKVLIADRVPPVFSFPDDMAHLISFRALELASADWEALIGDSAVIHHYAWNSLPASANANPAGDLTSNVSATLALLEAVRRRGGGRVIFASSGGTVYGRLQHVPVTEDHPLLPLTAYGAGKAAAEIYFGLYRNLYGLDCRIARIANPFGAGQNLIRGQGAVTKFLHCALTKQPIVIWGDGEVVRDFIHVVDVAAALVALAKAPDLHGHHTFNIGSGCGISLNQMITQLEVCVGDTLEVRRAQGRPFDVPVSVLDITRARSVFGWHPALSFAEAIARTMVDLSIDAPFSA